MTPGWNYETVLQIWRGIKTLLVIIDVLLGGIFIYALVGGWKYRPPIEIQEVKRPAFLTLRRAIWRERWQAILRKVSPASPESMRLAIIEADALVNNVLKEMGLEGEHMSDRLANLNPENYRHLEDLWRAHRLRNNLVHTPAFSLSLKETEETLAAYEAFLKEVEAI